MPCGALLAHLPKTPTSAKERNLGTLPTFQENCEEMLRKIKKKNRAWISLQLGIKPGLRAGIKGLERQGEGNQHNEKQQWDEVVSKGKGRELKIRECLKLDKI